VVSREWHIQCSYWCSTSSRQSRSNPNFLGFEADARFCTPVATPFGFNSLGWKYYLIWASLSASIVPVVWLFYPETTGLSMEEIDKVFIETATPLTARRDAVRAGAGASAGAARRLAMTGPVSGAPGDTDEEKGTVTEVERV
jgi:hypothetical protein